MEYEIVGKCPRTGKPVTAPRFWSSKKTVRPSYGMCACFPGCQKQKKKQ